MANKIGCRSIIEQNDAFLIVKETKNNKGVYGLPGGSLEGYEDLIECAIRETYEESGLFVEPSYLVGIYQEARTARDNNVVDLVFASLPVSGTVKPSRSHPEVDFYGFEDVHRMMNLGQLRSERIFNAISDYRNGQRVELQALSIIRAGAGLMISREESADAS